MKLPLRPATCVERSTVHDDEDEKSLVPAITLVTNILSIDILYAYLAAFGSLEYGVVVQSKPQKPGERSPQ